MTALLWAVFAASLVGSLHCVGMCGGFVVFYAGSDQVGDASWAPSPHRRQPRWVLHVIYNAGRLLTYLILGAVAGGIGAAVDLAGSALRLQRAAAVGAGGIMVLWGGSTLLALLGLRWPLWRSRRRTSQARSGVLRTLLHRIAGQSALLRALVVGTLTTLLPCGWLYAFLVVAAGAGGVVAGALVMAAFWLGTTPALLGLGWGVRRLAHVLGRAVPALSAMSMVLLGVLSLVGHLRLAPLLHVRPPANQAEALQSIESLRSERPCCKRITK